MPDISYTYDSITANVKNYRGYDNFIYSLHIKMTASNGVDSVSFERNYELDVDKPFSEEDPFIPFDQWNQTKVLAVADQLTETAQTKQYLARQLKIVATQPKPKSFNF